MPRRVAGPLGTVPAKPCLEAGGAVDKGRRARNAKTEQKRDGSRWLRLCGSDLWVNLREFGVFGHFSRVSGTFPYWSGNPSSSSLSVLQSLGLLLAKGM